MTEYSAIRGELNTGDIVMFSGNSTVSHAIKLLTQSKWSHVGMVIKLPESRATFIWESTLSSNLADIIDQKNKKGVQLLLLSERIKNFDGEVCIRQLQGAEITDDKYMSLMKFREEIKNRPYEQNYIELAKSAYDGPMGYNIDDISSLFCSELVAEAYQRIKILSVDPPSNEYVPKDFSAQSRKKIPFTEGISFGPEIPVVY